MLCPRLSRLLIIFTALLLICSFALAQDQDEANSGRNTWMGRFSAVDGEVNYRRAADTEQYWFDAAVNTPLGEDDQVFTSREGRAEIQLTGRNLVRLGYDTSFKITQFTTDLTQISLQLGTATFRVDSLDRKQFQLVDVRDLKNDTPLYFEVNTPTVAVTLVKTGVYRITVREDGTTEVSVQRGEAEVFNQELGDVVVRQGRRIVIEGDDHGYYQIAKLRDKDDWDRWNEHRDEELAWQYERSQSARYVPAGVPGVYDLDRYGEWYETPEYGYVWSPRQIGSDWAPYRAGYWNYYPSYGWTWVSSEVWGWAPYHYGRWAYHRNRWCWVPRGSFSVGFSWAPALVTFFGFGDGYNSGYRDGYSDGYRQGYRNGRYNWVGWVPLAPGERYYRHSRVVVNNTTINNYGPTQINNYRNHNAPGGMTGLSGRFFASNRVIVRNSSANNVTPPPVRDKDYRSAFSLRGDALRPVEPATQTPRETARIRPEVTHAASNRVVTRAQVFGRGNEGRPDGAVRSIERGVPTMRDSGSVNHEDGQRNTRESRREIFRRENPSNNPNNNTPGSVNGDNANQPWGNQNRRIERPADRPVERPTERNTNEPNRVERPVTPRIWGREPDQNRRPQNRETPRDNPTVQPRRSDIIIERPKREPMGPRTAPSEAPREVQRSEPRPEPRREVRPESRPEPNHEPRSERPSAPPREYSRPERPSSPPPSHNERPERPAPHQDAPPRNVERPSAPPKETSRPERAPRDFSGRKVQ